MRFALSDPGGLGIMVLQRFPKPLTGVRFPQPVHVKITA